MKRLIFFSAVVFFASFAQAGPEPVKVVIGYFSKETNAVFQAKTAPLFARFAENCVCELRNLTPYGEKGEYDPSQLPQALANLPENVSFLFFDWNERAADKNKDLARTLSGIVEKGRLLIAAAGIATTNEGSCPLNKTLMGQVTDSLIIGELTEKERLLPQCYYGPEMLSAIKPPKDLIGQGDAPLLFAARLACQWHRRKPQDWPEYLRSRKAKTKKLWAELDDFFPR